MLTSRIVLVVFAVVLVVFLLIMMLRPEGLFGRNVERA